MSPSPTRKCGIRRELCRIETKSEADTYMEDRLDKYDVLGKLTVGVHFDVRPGMMDSIIKTTPCGERSYLSLPPDGLRQKNETAVLCMGANNLFSNLSI